MSSQQSNGQEVMANQVPPICTIPIIDTSASMSSNGYVNSTKNTTKEYLDFCRVGDKFALVEFNTSARAIYPTDNTIASIDENRNEVEKAKTAIENLSFNGSNTNIPAGIYKAKTIADPIFLVRGLVLLSDGYNNVSTLPLDEVLPDNYPVHTCAMGDKADQNYLAEIARRTGGTFYPVVHPSEMLKVYIDILGQYANVEVVINQTFSLKPQEYYGLHWIVSNGNPEVSVIISWDDPSLKYTDSPNPESDEFSIYFWDILSFFDKTPTVVGEGYVVYHLDANDQSDFLLIDMINGSTNKTINVTVGVVEYHNETSAPISLDLQTKTKRSDGNAFAAQPEYSVKAIQDGKPIEDLDISASIVELVNPGLQRNNEEISDNAPLRIRRYSITSHQSDGNGSFIGKLRDIKGAKGSLVTVCATGKSPVTGQTFHRTKLISL